MHNLYEKDCTEDLVNLQDKIKEKISTINFSDKEEKKIFCFNIKRYKNLLRYQNDRNNKQLCKKVNTWFIENVDFLDSSKRAFENSFTSNYGERIFELAMADFIKKNSLLKKREIQSGIPDLEFCYNQKTYYLDATTRDSSILIDYLTKHLPNFDHYFEIAKIFHQANENFKKINPEWEQEWYWSTYVYQEIWRYLDATKQHFISEKLQFSSQYIEKKHLEKFTEWVAHSQIIAANFEAILPEIVKEKLSEIKLNGVLDSSGGKIRHLPNLNNSNKLNFQKILARLVAQSIIDKTNKEYFEGDTPVIIACSLSLMHDYKMIDSAEKLIEGIHQFLPETLMQVSQEKKPESPIKNLEKLYAVIIDTSWYNWMPEIAGASMPAGYNNCYGIIYNTNLSEEVSKNSNVNLFKNTILYKYALNFASIK